MKKIILLLLLITLSLSGCKKHVTEIASQPQYIVGEWKLEKITVFGREQTITPCHKRSYMIFESNHDAESKYYTIYQASGNCIMHLSYQGQWSYEDDKFYFHVTQSNTSSNPDLKKELHFLDTEHFYIIETFQGISGNFYFKKVD
jgi:hypothetical protein